MPTRHVQPHEGDNLQSVADLLLKARKIVVITGAGISTNSGIPDFRSQNGLYSLIQTQYDAAAKEATAKAQDAHTRRQWEAGASSAHDGHRDYDDTQRPSKRRKFFSSDADHPAIISSSPPPPDRRSRGGHAADGQARTAEAARSPILPALRPASVATPLRRALYDGPSPSPFSPLSSPLSDFTSTPYSTAKPAASSASTFSHVPGVFSPRSSPPPRVPSPGSFPVELSRQGSVAGSSGSGSGSGSGSSPSIASSTAPSEYSDDATLPDLPDLSQMSEVVRTLPNIKGKDLFDARIWTDSTSASVFYTFTTTLRQTVRDASPTSTHFFIRHLRDSGRLVRCYTQNIDMIEEKVGLCTSLAEGAGAKGRFARRWVQGGRGKGPAKNSTAKNDASGRNSPASVSFAVADFPAAAAAAAASTSASLVAFSSPTTTATATAAAAKGIISLGPSIRQRQRRLPSLAQTPPAALTPSSTTLTEATEGDPPCPESSVPTPVPANVERPRPSGGAECVFLHGSLGYLRCFQCRRTSDWDAYDRELETLAGLQPDCPHCAGATAARLERGKRALGIGKLRPDIVLYGEEHPDSHLISPIVTFDLGLAPDLLLILGTSLRVHGLKVMVREFAKAVHARSGGPGHVVFVNFTRPSGSIWGDVIDFWVECDCDAWVEDLKNKVPELWGVRNPEQPKKARGRPTKESLAARKREGAAGIVGFAGVKEVAEAAGVEEVSGVAGIKEIAEVAEVAGVAGVAEVGMGAATGAATVPTGVPDDISSGVPVVRGRKRRACGPKAQGRKRSCRETDGAMQGDGPGTVRCKVEDDPEKGTSFAVPNARSEFTTPPTRTDKFAPDAVLPGAISPAPPAATSPAASSSATTKTRPVKKPRKRPAAAVMGKNAVYSSTPISTVSMPTAPISMISIPTAPVSMVSIPTAPVSTAPILATPTPTAPTSVASILLSRILAATAWASSTLLPRTSASCPTAPPDLPATAGDAHETVVEFGRCADAEPDAWDRWGLDEFDDRSSSTNIVERMIEDLGVIARRPASSREAVAPKLPAVNDARGVPATPPPPTPPAPPAPRDGISQKKSRRRSPEINPPLPNFPTSPTSPAPAPLGDVPQKKRRGRPPKQPTQPNTTPMRPRKSAQPRKPAQPIKPAQSRKPTPPRRSARNLVPPAAAPPKTSEQQPLPTISAREPDGLRPPPLEREHKHAPMPSEPAPHRQLSPETPSFARDWPFGETYEILTAVKSNARIRKRRTIDGEEVSLPVSRRSTPAPDLPKLSHDRRESTPSLTLAPILPDSQKDVPALDPSRPPPTPVEPRAPETEVPSPLSPRSAVPSPYRHNPLFFGDPPAGRFCQDRGSGVLMKLGMDGPRAFGGLLTGPDADGVGEGSKLPMSSEMAAVHTLARMRGA